MNFKEQTVVEHLEEFRKRFIISLIFYIIIFIISLFFSNKIYKLLMTKLSKNEQTKLRESQKAWIQKKEKEAKAAAAKMEGGTGAGYLYIITELDMTKEKAIELAKRYDKLNK